MTGVQPGHGKLAGLDGVRAIAVLLVMAFHNDVVGVGWIGVQIFFVLSGYLITRILYASRQASFGHYLRSFYGRRTLRIFPLYFATLVVLAIANWAGFAMHGVREGLPYAATYTYNFYHVTAGWIHSRMISHFWSLCVEEQFYLVWPMVIYFAPDRTLRWLLPLLALSGPLLRGVEWWVLEHYPAYFIKRHDIALYALTPTHLDAFAAGAAVSLFPPRDGRPAIAMWAALAALALGTVFLRKAAIYFTPAFSFGYPLGMEPGHAFLWACTLMNVVSACLIYFIAQKGFAVPILEWRPLRYIGVISYGFYVMHFPLQELVHEALPHSGVWIRMALQFVMTIALASASYYGLELPFLRFKDRWFPTPSRRTRPA